MFPSIVMKDMNEIVSALLVEFAEMIFRKSVLTVNVLA